jgi:hypothetical protein
MRALSILSRGLAGYVEFRYRYIATVINLIKRMQVMSPHSKFFQMHHSLAEEEILEKEDVKKLAKVVEESLERIAKLTKLPVQEVLHIIEEVDVAQLKQATQEAIKNISHATDLDAAHITAIFKENKTATVDNIVHRLREESHVHRARI